ncbi:MAG: two component transcriptional regulator, AraC family [Paenibacillaceae bacterium]|jgi:two-component system response regulator YesN|nr:two component transcriptional regulator, AraC family [Paenibacillaceae bacterium]
MLYKLVIADDEDIIRGGIISVIPWESLGFEIAADFDDGKATIEYIDGHPVDVVLTDIRMSHVSGLELAEYVSRSKPDLKVVLISGYKDFEYAKQAIRCNVASYITKPVNFEELYSLFRELKLELDREREKSSLSLERSKRYKEMLPLLQEQFLTDLLRGVLQDPGAISRRMEMLEMGIDPAGSPCCMIQIRFSSLEQYLLGRWQQGKDGLKKALYHFFLETVADIRYYPALYSQKELMVLAAAPPGMETSLLSQRAAVFFRNKQSAIHSLMGLEMEFTLQAAWESLHAMAAHYSDRSPMPGDNGNGGSSEREDGAFQVEPFLGSGCLKRLQELQDLFLSYINSGDGEAVHNLMDSYWSQLQSLPPKQIRYFIVDLFATIAVRLKAVGLDLWTLRNGEGSYYDTAALNPADISVWKSWCLVQLDDIMDCLEQEKASSGNWVLHKAVEFIHDNYQRDISLEDVAGHVFLSNTYFSQMFKEGKGITFTDYLVRVRMEKAMELLTSSTYKILEISQMVGYRSSKYFARSFRKVHGCSPTEYLTHLQRGKRR